MIYLDIDGSGSSNTMNFFSSNSATLTLSLRPSTIRDLSPAKPYDPHKYK